MKGWRVGLSYSSSVSQILMKTLRQIRAQAIYAVLNYHGAPAYLVVLQVDR